MLAQRNKKQTFVEWTKPPDFVLKKVEEDKKGIPFVVNKLTSSMSDKCTTTNIDIVVGCSTTFGHLACGCIINIYNISLFNQKIKKNIKLVEI